MAEKTIFDFLTNLYLKQGLKYNKKLASSYLISLWLSHDKSLIEMVNEINTYQFLLSDELIYKYYYYKVPKGKRYIKWIKKDEVKDKKVKESQDKIKKNLQLSKLEMSKFSMFTNMLEKDKIDKNVKLENASNIFLKRGV